MVPESFRKRNVPKRKLAGLTPQRPMAWITQTSFSSSWGRGGAFLPSSMFTPLPASFQCVPGFLQLVPASQGPLPGSAEPLRHCEHCPRGGSREPLPAQPLTSPCLPGSGSFLDLRSQDVNWANDFPFVLAKGPSVGVRTNMMSFLTMKFCCGEDFFCKPLEFHL